MKTKSWITSLLIISFSSVVGFSLKSYSSEQENMKPHGDLKPTWIKPSTDICINSGGVTNKSECNTTWKEAKKICQVMGGRLPNIEEYKAIIEECGDNSICYQKIGFSLQSGYWSSTSQTPYNHAWIAYFNTAHYFHFSKDIQNYVRCIY